MVKVLDFYLVFCHPYVFSPPVRISSRILISIFVIVIPLFHPAALYPLASLIFHLRHGCLDILN